MADANEVEIYDNYLAMLSLKNLLVTQP